MLFFFQDPNQGILGYYCGNCELFFMYGNFVRMCLETRALYRFFFNEILFILRIYKCLTFTGVATAAYPRLSFRAAALSVSTAIQHI